MRRLAPLLLLAGCAAVERAPEPASVALPERFALLDAEGGRSASADLIPLGDPAFVSLAGAAMDDAPTLAAALARVEAARAGIRGARASRLPNVEAGGSASVQRSSSAMFGSLPPGIDFDRDRTVFEGSVDASWDADLFGRLRASERAARARFRAATAEAEAVRLALVTDIARAVVDYRAAEARRTVVEADLAETRTLVDLTRVRSEAGITPGFDLVRAQSLEAQAAAQLEPIAAERAAALAALVALTARSTDAVLAALSAGGESEAAPVPVLEVPSVLLRRRPDIIAAEQRLAAADAEIAAAAAERFPRLSISGSIGLIALALGDLFESDAVIGSLGAGVAGPLLDFGRVGARIDARQAEAAEAFAAYRGALFTGLAEVERALGQIAAADRRAEALAARVAVERDALSLARERYRRGLSDFLSVVDAQRQLNATREAEIVARADRRRRRIELYRAIGGYGETLPSIEQGQISK